MAKKDWPWGLLLWILSAQGDRRLVWSHLYLYIQTELAHIIYQLAFKSYLIFFHLVITDVASDERGEVCIYLIYVLRKLILVLCSSELRDSQPVSRLDCVLQEELIKVVSSWLIQTASGTAAATVF